MKYFFSIILAIVFHITAFTQFKIVAQSEPFDEPSNNFGKLVQMSNGNTLFLLTTKTEVTVKLYDKNHRQIAERPIAKQGSDIQSIEEVFELNGNLVCFYKTSEHSQDDLYRLIIDGKTGSLKHADKVATLDNSAIHHVAINPGYTPTTLQHSFYIRSDPSGQYYAIAICNTYGSGNGRQIEIIYYGPENTEIGRSFYNAPEKYVFIQYLDMVVVGSQKVAVLAFAGNTTRRRNRDGELILATLDSGAKSLNLDELDLSKEIVVEGGITRYNPVTKTVVLLAACRQPKDNGYTSLMAFVDPFERAVKNVFTIFPEQASAKSEELFGKKNDFTGMPQNMFVDDFGDISVVFEEMTTYSDRYGSTTFLGSLAVSRFDPNGKKINDYLIPKGFGLDGYLGTFYHSEQEGSAPRLYGGNQYKHFSYLNGTGGKDFILLNDLAENDEIIKKGKKPKRVIGVLGCDAFYFPLNGNTPLPDRQFLFGKPEAKKEHQLALFSISDYDRSNNRYATLQLDHEGRSRQVRVVWLTPQ